MSQSQQPQVAIVAWTKFERMLQSNGVLLKDVLYEDGAVRMDIIRSVNGGQRGKDLSPTKKPTSMVLTPLEVALVSAQWNRLVPPKGTAGPSSALSPRKEADQANGAVAVPGGYLVEPTHVRPHQNASTESLLKSFTQHANSGSAAPALSVASELLQRDSSVLARHLQEYLPHVTVTQVQEVLGVKAPTAATLSH